MTEFRIPGLQIVADSSVFRKHLTRTPAHSLALLAVLVFLGLESYYLLFRFGEHIQDLKLYRNTAMKILDGEVPFRDFRLEYPILTLIPIVIPGILSKLAGGSFQSYVFWFVVQNLTLGLMIATVIGKMDIQGKALPRYFMAMLFFLPVFLFRFDPFPALLTILAIFCISNKPFFSGIWLMASVAAKLYAIVLVPVFVVYCLFNGGWGKLLWQFAGFICVCMAIVCCTRFVEMDQAFDFMHYHLLRGIQIESLAGGILLLLESAGIIGLDIEHTFGAMHLITPLSADILKLTSIGTPICFVVMTAYLARSFYTASQRAGAVPHSWLIPAMAAQILLFILLNKVFSPQYMVWLLPLIPFCRFKAFLIFIIALMLTVMIFPGHYYSLVSKQLPMVVILNIRNALLIWLFIELIREVNPTKA
ncbi:hypothetical protein LZD49_22590 [Dyadobacter sp. CY261]|uniref:hypothetical protein n=1 Tax=Dyadobacter sp. CY261 TaxID=2907203 RepID=UPI001F36A638|nr:hypothetical protein [Dyadobacter sp. CY261]MCF0073284.1 hypothetical protein [Dyadobacter sp. CY261]